MQYIEVINKWLLAYKDVKIVISGFQSYAKIWYDVTGNTNYEIFETEALMQARIDELFIQMWQHEELPIRIKLPLHTVIEKYSAKIDQIKADGAPYYYYNKNNAIMLYLSYISEEDKPILEADQDVIIEYLSEMQ